MELNTDMNEDLKISYEEWIGIIVFSLTMLLTLNVNIAFPLTIISYTSFVIIKGILIYCNEDEKKFFEKVKNYGIILLFIFLILYVVDIILTYLVVVRWGIGIETNGFLVSMWRIFGYELGIALHMIIFGIFILYSFYTFDDSKNYKRILVNFIFVLIGVILWSLAFINNLSVLFTSFCHI